jgi:Secreted repeat of unknown function
MNICSEGRSSAGPVARPASITIKSYSFAGVRARPTAYSGHVPTPLKSRIPRAGVKQSLLGMSRRANGSEQVTYAGHPLYRFLQDRKPCQTKGEGSHAFGAGWDVLSPAGKTIGPDD